MLPNPFHSPLCRVAAALALALILARCTPGGQFDPSTLLDNDMFDTKTKLKGQREPLFPNGVPGATTGVPADLVKGYKPPPDQADADPDAINAPPPDQATQQAAQPAAKPRPETKPEAKPKVAVARRRPASEKPPASTPTRIDIGAKGAPAQAPVSTNWPAPPPTGAGSQQNVVWPAPPPTAPQPQQAAQQSQNIWPAPPSTAPAQPAAAPAPAPQSGPSFDSMWPKSTNGTQSQ